MAGAPKGNNNAGKGHEYQRALRKALARKYDSASEGLLEIATKLVESAEEGEMWAIKEVADRIDGKPPQIQIHQGDEDQPVIARIERVIIHSSNKDG